MGRMARQLIPLPGLTEEETRALSRQMRYKIRLAADGTCPSCGERRLMKGKSLCPSCLVVHRERMRQRTKAKTRHSGSSSYALEAPLLPQTDSAPEGCEAGADNIITTKPLFRPGHRSRK